MDRIDAHLHVWRYDAAAFGWIAPGSVLAQGQLPGDVRPAFVVALPGGALVLDHGGKPDIAGGEWQPWADAVAAIADVPNVACKLSGLVTIRACSIWSRRL